VLIDGVDATAVFNKMGGSDAALRYLAGSLVLVEAKPKPEPTPKVYLHRLFEAETIVVNATDGDTFVGSGVFPGGVYKKTLPVAEKSVANPATNAVVYELTANGTFVEVFGSLGEGRLRWTEAQVVAFCRDHRGKLRTNNYATFFELEGGFVAVVYFGDRGKLRVDVDSFWGVTVWNAGYAHRFVVLL
jgi:hypothetical protein